MAQKSSFFDTAVGDPREYPAREFAEYFACFIGNGIFGGGTVLKVDPNGSDHRVKVNIGHAWINGYMYSIFDGPIVLNVDLTSGSNRIDRIVLRLDTSIQKRSVTVVVKKGSSPTVAPALTRAGEVYEISLAQVVVKSGVVIIDGSQITDERLNNSLCGIVTGVIDQADTTAIFNQFQAWYETRTAQYQSQWNDWLTASTAAYSSQWTTWYNANTSSFSAAWHSWFNATKTAWQDWFDHVSHDAPVVSVNGKAGVVELTSADVGAASIAQLADIGAEMIDINLMPQSPLPAKQGISTNSPKLVRKIDANHYHIFQKGDKGYLKYILHKVNGDSSVSYGGTWQLLRLLSVQQVLDALVWKEPVPTTGTLTKAIAGAGTGAGWNSIDANLVYKQPSFQEGNQDLSLYDLAASSEVTFTLATRKKGKANILFLGNTGRSSNVDIYVNDVMVKSFPANLGGLSANYQTVEFPIPSIPNSAETCTVKIKNTDTVNKFSFVALNFYRLEEHDGQEVNSFKFYVNNSYFINETGASDYALRDTITGKWFGSYHGGEVSQYLKGTWNGSSKNGDDFFASESDLNTVANGAYTIVKNLTIKQKTKLIGIADMVSIYDFNVDGTMNMNFALSNCTVPLSYFYTALTCTHTDFTQVSYPEDKAIKLSGDTPLKIQGGFVEQVTPTGERRQGIRYSIFNNKYNTLGPFIRNNAAYSKFYYGIVCEYPGGVVIPNLTFSKALDFYNLKI